LRGGSEWVVRGEGGSGKSEAPSAKMCEYNPAYDSKDNQHNESNEKIGDS
jgi:ABC-type molybdenum transport system ATPase subunit/photorepair protein PhrA